LEGLEVNPSFWRGKRVFLTGHTGFKGAWLSLWLQQLGANVTGYSLNPPTTPSLFEIAKVAEGMNSIVNDIRDGAALVKELKKDRSEIVIHMAAQSTVLQSYLDPVETYSTNVMGTVNLLDAVRQTSTVRAVLIVTTDKCYENKEWLWPYRENDPLGGYDPYSNSKGCAELVTAAYRNSFFNPTNYTQHGVAVATARAGNVIGGGDWSKDRLIPSILLAFQNSKTVVIRNPQAERPWQHVLEPLSGYLNLTEKIFYDGEKYVGGWNFGPNEEDVRTVQWIVEYMINRWHKKVTWTLDNNYNPHEAENLRLDISKAKIKLGWAPKWKLEKALNSICDWQISWLNNMNMSEICINQINEFSKNIAEN